MGSAVIKTRAHEAFCDVAHSGKRWTRGGWQLTATCPVCARRAGRAIDIAATCGGCNTYAKHCGRRARELLMLVAEKHSRMLGKSMGAHEYVR